VGGDGKLPSFKLLHDAQAVLKYLCILISTSSEEAGILPKLEHGDWAPTIAPMPKSEKDNLSLR